MLHWRRRSGTLLTLVTENDVMLHWRRRSSTPLTLVTETDVMLHWRPGTPLTLVTETDVVLHWRRPAHHVKILPTWMGWMVQRKSCNGRQSKSFVSAVHLSSSYPQDRLPDGNCGRCRPWAVFPHSVKTRAHAAVPHTPKCSVTPTDNGVRWG